MSLPSGLLEVDAESKTPTWWAASVGDRGISLDWQGLGSPTLTVPPWEPWRRTLSLAEESGEGLAPFDEQGFFRHVNPFAGLSRLDELMSSPRQQLRTLAIDVAIMVIAGFAPAILMGIIGWSDGANVAILAGLAVFIACMGGMGWRTGLVISVPFALLTGLADWAAPNPWLAAIVLAIAAFLRGYAAKAGLHDALTMSVIALGFIAASPVPSSTSIPSPVLVGVVSLVAALWATLLMYLLRHRLPVRQHTGLDPVRVIPFSLILAALVGVATWFVVDLNLGHTGGWIILTILVVFQPTLGAGFVKAAHRAAGTVLGFVIAIIIGALVTNSVILSLAGAAFLMISFILLLQGRAYWLYATVLTPAIVLLESAGSTVDEVADERLAATLIGVAATVLVMLALVPVSKYLSARSAAGTGPAQP